MDKYDLEEFLECTVITVPEDKALEAAAMISGCAVCDAQGGNVPFDWFLAEVMGKRTGMYEFILEEPVRCPVCRSEVNEGTPVDSGGIEVTA